MPEGDSKAGLYGLLAAAIGFIFLQVRTFVLNAKLAKAEAATKKLAQKIKVERQQVAAEKIETKAAALEARIGSRVQRLGELYEKIDVLDIESKSVAERVESTLTVLPGAGKRRAAKRRAERRARRSN